MDRRSFLQPTVTNNAIYCGNDDCVCEEMVFPNGEVTRKKYPFQLFIIAGAALLCAMIFIIINENGSGAGIIRMKKPGIIACAPSAQTNEMTAGHREPANKDKEKGCPHQSMFSCMACSTDSKRKKNQAG